MKPADRQNWILNYLEAKQKPVLYRVRVDVLDSKFVDDYLQATGAKHSMMMYGAHKCRQLGRDLAALADIKQLERQRIGIGGMAGMGFPSWVWSYSLLNYTKPKA